MPCKFLYSSSYCQLLKSPLNRPLITGRLDPEKPIVFGLQPNLSMLINPLPQLTKNKAKSSRVQRRPIPKRHYYEDSRRMYVVDLGGIVHQERRVSRFSRFDRRLSLECAGRSGRVNWSVMDSFAENVLKKCECRFLQTFHQRISICAVSNLCFWLRGFDFVGAGLCCRCVRRVEELP